MTKREELEKKLAEKIGNDEVGEDWLDDMVHELKSNEAADINNEGVTAQLDYIDNEGIFASLIEDLNDLGPEMPDEETGQMADDLAAGAVEDAVMDEKFRDE